MEERDVFNLAVQAAEAFIKEGFNSMPEHWRRANAKLIGEGRADLRMEVSLAPFPVVRLMLHCAGKEPLELTKLVDPPTQN